MSPVEQLKMPLDRRLAVDFVGRKEELAFLLQILEPSGPLVVHLYGIMRRWKNNASRRIQRASTSGGSYHNPAGLPGRRADGSRPAVGTCQGYRKNARFCAGGSRAPRPGGNAGRSFARHL